MGDAVAKKKDPHYFQGREFCPGDIKRYLRAEEYDIIVGLDEGHGENLVCGYRMTQKGEGEEPDVWEMDQLPLNPDKELRLPSYLGYNGSSAVAGAKAVFAQEFYAYFKQPPAKWEKKLDLGKRTRGQLMEDHIRTLWNQVKAENWRVAQAAEKDRVLLAVGCPACDDWMDSAAMEEYAGLIRRATGCTQVRIIPESTAAIMSAMMDAKEGARLRLDRGVAILDCGSSTLDFTYVLMGKRLVTRSIAIGGHDIDKLMLAQAVKQSGLTMADVALEQRQSIYVKLREYKELFYDCGKETLGWMTIPLWGIDPEGRADLTRSGGELKFLLDRKFMDAVLQEYRTLKPEKGNLAGRSWAQCCRDFVSNTMGSFGDLPCEKIVLTGGTSAVTQVRQIVEECYGPERVIISSQPAASVARGLCYTLRFEADAAGKMAQYEEDVQNGTRYMYEDEFLSRLSGYFVHVACGILRDELERVAMTNGSIACNTLIERVMDRAKTDERLIGEPGRKAVMEEYGHMSGSNLQSVRRTVNKFSAVLYGTSVSEAPQLQPLGNDQAREAIEAMDWQTLVDSAWIEAMIPDMLMLIISGVLYVLGLLCMEMPVLGFALIGLAALVGSGWSQIKKALVKLNLKLSNANCKRILKRLNDDMKLMDIVHKASKRLYPQLAQKAPMRQQFYGDAMEQFELDLGKVLFLVFEDKPDSE